jgi:hypothetical protein
MYAYTMACAHYNLPHAVFREYMVSDEDCPGTSYPLYISYLTTRHRAIEFEGWEWIEQIETLSCHHPVANHTTPMPTFLHAASAYKAAMPPPYDNRVWSFHKGRVPPQMITCDAPLLVPPPDHFFDAMKGSKNPFDRRNAYMICALTYQLNQAMLAHKQQFCNNGMPT